MNIMYQIEVATNQAWFSDPDRTVRSDRDNWEPLTNTVLLTTRTVLCTKSRKPFEPRLNRPDLRTMNGSHSSDQRFKKKRQNYKLIAPYHHPIISISSMFDRIS